MKLTEIKKKQSRNRLIDTKSLLMVCQRGGKLGGRVKKVKDEELQFVNHKIVQVM